MKPDTPYHVTETFDLPENVSIEEAYSRFGYEGRLEDAVDATGEGVVDADGTAMAFIGRTVTYYSATVGTTRTARERWFECPVTGEWLPWSNGVTISGVRYSREAAADLIEDRRRRRL